MNNIDVEMSQTHLAAPARKEKSGAPARPSTFHQLERLSQNQIGNCHDCENRNIEIIGACSDCGDAFLCRECFRTH
jgi:hypothetical protein